MQLFLMSEIRTRSSGCWVTNKCQETGAKDILITREGGEADGTSTRLGEKRGEKSRNQRENLLNIEVMAMKPIINHRNYKIRQNDIKLNQVKNLPENRNIQNDVLEMYILINFSDLLRKYSTGKRFNEDLSMKSIRFRHGFTDDQLVRGPGNICTHLNIFPIKNMMSRGTNKMRQIIQRLTN